MKKIDKINSLPLCLSLSMFFFACFTNIAHLPSQIIFWFICNICTMGSANAFPFNKHINSELWARVEMFLSCHHLWSRYTYFMSNVMSMSPTLIHLWASRDSPNDKGEWTQTDWDKYCILRERRKKDITEPGDTGWRRDIMEESQEAFEGENEAGTVQ